jgi:flagella basal body P-ring formation protein FlgA
MTKITSALLTVVVLFCGQAMAGVATHTLEPEHATGRGTSTTTAAVVEPGSYADLIQAFLMEQAAPYDGTVQVTVDPLDTSRFAPCERAEAFLTQGARLRSRLTVGLRCLTPQPWVTYAQASISIEGNYYVSARPIKAGTTLAADDISERTGDILRLPAGVARDPNALVGSVATQRIAAGSAIRTNVLRSAESIQRGQAVRLEARGNGFVATSEGKAMQGGEPGTQIQVRTPSGQMVSGTVLNAHTVLVLM